MISYSPKSKSYVVCVQMPPPLRKNWGEGRHLSPGFSLRGVGGGGHLYTGYSYALRDSEARLPAAVWEMSQQSEDPRNKWRLSLRATGHC